MDRILSSPNSYVEALTSNVIVFRDRAYKEEIKVELGYEGPWSDRISVLTRRDSGEQTLSLPVHTTRWQSSTTQEKRPHNETHLVGTLLSDF